MNELGTMLDLFQAPKLLSLTFGPMKNAILFLALFLTIGMTSALTAQDKGIQFAKVSFDEAKSLADQEDKLIFMDGYAVWCGPCRYMAANVFTDPEVGELFNRSFVNLKMDMEKGEGPRLARVYRLTAYPTLFILDSEGQVLEKKVGGMNTAQFKAWAKKAIQRHRPDLLGASEAAPVLRLPAEESWYAAIESGNKDKMMGMTRRMYPSENLEDQMAVIGYWHQYAKFNEQPGLYMATMTELLKHSNYATDVGLNNAAWYAMDLTQDEGYLLQAVAWIEKAMDQKASWYSYDTIARLMYSQGDVELDREFAEKALTRARTDDGDVEGIEQFIRSLGVN